MTGQGCMVMVLIGGIISILIMGPIVLLLNALGVTHIDGFGFYVIISLCSISAIIWVPTFYTIISGIMKRNK